MTQKEYWIASDGHSVGPLTEDAVRSLVVAGKVHSDDYAWHTHLAEWRPLREILPPLPPAQREQQPPPIAIVEPPTDGPPPQTEDQGSKGHNYSWLWFVVGVAVVGIKVWTRGSMEHGALAPYAGLIIVGCLIWFVYACNKSR